MGRKPPRQFGHDLPALAGSQPQPAGDLYQRSPAAAAEAGLGIQRTDFHAGTLNRAFGGGFRHLVDSKLRRTLNRIREKTIGVKVAA
jgi:hypothetical protein